MKRIVRFYTLEDANAFLAIIKRVNELGVGVKVQVEQIPVRFGSEGEYIYRIDCEVVDGKETKDAVQE